MSSSPENPADNSSQPAYQFSEDYHQCHEANWSRLLAPLKGRPGLNVLEIGSFEGRSAIWLLNNLMTDPAARLTCVDLFCEWGPAFDHNIALSGHGAKVRKIKGRSETILPHLAGEKFDLIYVDGHHGAMNVLFDAVSSWTLLAPGGYLIFDDYLWELTKPALDRPKLAVDLFLKALYGQYTLLMRHYQVILRKN